MVPPGSEPGDVTDVVVELAVSGGQDAVDLASADLWAAGATAVGQREADVVTLIASFPTPEAARVVAAELGGTAVAITDTSWQDRWKEFAQPVEVGPGLVVAPGWREVVVDPGAAPGAGGRLVVRIDPGPCFGSGSHPSTRLVLRLLMGLARAGGGPAGSDPGGLGRPGPPAGPAPGATNGWVAGLAGRRVLDVGCGSGILSVTAARLGARVTAIDVDPAAVTFTARNAAANAVADLIEASTRPVEDAGGGFDVALVNVTAGVHARLGAPTAAAVHPGGTLLLAGLLPGQWRHLSTAYPTTAVIDRPQLEGWEGVVLARR